MNFTLKQMIEMFNAGTRWGESSATAYEWGCGAGSTHQEELVFALQEILNEDKAWDANDRFSDAQVAALVKKVLTPV